MIKLIVSYFALCGLAGHLLVIVWQLHNPSFFYQVKEHLQKELGLLQSTPALALSEQQILAQIDAAFSPWQPDNTHYPPADGIWLNAKPMPSLKQALAQLKSGDTLKIGAGIYRQAMVIAADDVTIIGYGHVIFEQAAVNGKGLILAKGNNLSIHNIECRHISVESGNGACVRLQGVNLTLQHVFFHSSETGVLETAKTPGLVTIIDSRFQRLGKSGQAHGIYLGSANLTMRNSMVLASKDQGHEIKSRGQLNVIEHSIVASFDADDSRLIDISNGGSLKVTDSVLQQGRNSANHQAIGFALEGEKYQQQQVILSNNQIILERQGSNMLLKHRGNNVAITISDNIIVGADSDYAGNTNVAGRSAAAIAAAPYLPPLLCDLGQRCKAD